MYKMYEADKLPLSEFLEAVQQFVDTPYAYQGAAGVYVPEHLRLLLTEVRRQLARNANLSADIDKAMKEIGRLTRERDAASDLSRLQNEEDARAGLWPVIKSENGGAICPDCDQNMLTADGCTKETIVLKHAKSGLDLSFNRMLYSSVETERCHDCGAKPGHFHHLGCDMEVCPQCGGQLFCCDCWHDEKDGD